MSKKQATLFKFGFTKHVNHRNKVVKVVGNYFSPDAEGLNKCHSCEIFFKTKQVISSHSLWAHTISLHTKSYEAKAAISNYLLEKDVRGNVFFFEGGKWL